MTYRNDTEAENLRLKAELESAKAELETLKEKYLPKKVTKEQAIKDLSRAISLEILDKEPSEGLKGYYPPNITNRSFLDDFRDPHDLVKVGCCIALGLGFGLLALEWVLLFTL